ncbi:SpaA isopeptide-forming pilin-related protein [Blautia intestinalis]|uniref:SpaA isopeptide-forming pilin-related protein n=1 Tax=Blautia intestinalis TaxID=2763028 RepID=UPI0022E7B079|nr:SpaA isopeptide-forming pilin-related protein [Blautia intestinalis]
MKKRKWHKITAALATVAVILSSPGITDLVKGSSTEFVDMVPISEETIPASENEENISRATEDFSDTTEDFFETTEEPEENFGSETAAEEGSENNEADSVDCIEDFSCEDTSNTENVSPDSASAVTVLQKADETENTELAQGEVHKAKISSSVPEGQEAAKVRLYLTDAQNETPVTDLKITLSSGESTQEIAEDPVQLPEALNQNEPLTVTPVTEYQLDEDGDYVFDEDGNYQIAAYYLEYEVPSGGSTAFEASFTYTTDAEEYDFQAKLRARMFREPEGTDEEISLNEEESRLTLIWNSQAEQETEDDALVEMEELAAEDVGEARPLKAGDWLFLDVQETTSWKFDNAQVSINYGVSGQSWNKKPMTKGNDGRFRIQLTPDIVGENNSFKFTLDNPNEGEKKWMPSGMDLSFTQNNGSNLYIANGDDNGAWGNVWYDPLNDHTFFAGKTMYFENNTEESLNAVKAVFYEKDADGKPQQVGDPVLMTGIQKGFSVTIPAAACSYVQFKDASGKILGDTYSNFYGQGADEEDVESFLFAAGSMDCYKYAGTPEESTWGVLGERTVYYDATLSKMSYAGSSGNDGKGIPCDSNSKVYYYATKENGKDPVYGEMTPVKDSDLWSVSLSGVYTKIRFAGYAVENETISKNGAGTKLENIPENLKNPCYFGDDSDDVIYEGGNRGGYWGEKGSLRDAESGKKKTVVNVPEGTFTRDSNTLYVDTTLYDYYTDYELNGQNRDEYKLVDIASHRIYQPFRQFNQALSTYYKQNNVTYPLYWGNFQNFTGSHYSEIAGTLNLYGYSENEKNKFFYENNSMWDSNGQKIEQEGQNATQGLSGAQLASGSLTLAGGAIAPFFNEDFLKGNNSKHTVLGNVYHNVTFPFIKKALTSSADTSKAGTVDYWCFDSADQTNSNKNLRLKYDSSNGYFLQSTNDIVKGQTVESGHPATADGNYFPLNSSESGYACRLNYGFGQKLQLKFRLTQDGTVTTTSNEKVPIEFNFSGDDDVWVFIDDQLVLDVGGDHDVVSGRINFRDKKAWVSKVKNQSGGGFTNNKITDFPESLINGSDFYKKEHTLTMFYMERGLWESNMKVTFNFPDENQLQVEKQVDATDVNALFKDLFKDTDLFDFKIKNLATHYGEKAASATTTAPVKISDLAYTVAPVPDTGNIFEKASNEGFKDSVHWYAKEQDVESTCRSQRYGELTLNDPLDISNMQYLKFKFYYDYDDTPSLSNMYLQLEDSSGNTAGCLDKETLSGRTYGTVSVASKKWITVKLDLTKLSGIKGFGNLKKIRFGYNYPRDIYLKNFIFRPTAELTASTGFATKQYDIADYGSAKSGNLENPKGAVYTSSAKSGAYAIEDDGSFVLRDKETITFRDQFRRGSYIYLKEKVDPNLFDTTWTMFENGQSVTSMGAGRTVTNGSDVSSLNEVKGLSVNDGRKENIVLTDAEGKNPQENNKYDGDRPKKQPSENTSEKVPEDTFVFRSYAKPDDTTTLTKLKAVFYNKVKTGSLKLTKSPAYSPADDSLNGTYTFKITFTNVGGAGLEKEPIVQTVQLNLNETKEITGIPIGTFFTIEETETSDGSTLDSICLNGVPQEKGTTVLHGDINTDKKQAEVVFKNTKKPKVNLSVEKFWKTAAGETYTGTLPEKIYVQLQRRSSDTSTTATWEAVDYNNSIYTELTYNIYTEEWKTSFKDLDKFVDYTKTQQEQVAWQYRIVEVILTKDADGKVTKVTPVENGGCIEFTDASGKRSMFKVSYGEDNNGFARITNTYQPLTDIQILKIKAGTSGENQVKLGGAEFKLEKLTADGISDSAFAAQTVITGKENEELGVAKFENLEDGTYQITETKAPERYNLLKSPIKVVINRSENFITVDRDPKNYIGSLKNNTLTIQVANQAKFQLPATGSWSRLILGFTGAIIAGTAVIMYLLLQKRRKEGKTS